VNKTQEQLFNRLIDLKNDIQGSAGFIQNDFEHLLKSKVVTKENIMWDLVLFERQLDSIILKTSAIKHEVRKLVTHNE